jgi:hypothetical protein
LADTSKIDRHPKIEGLYYYYVQGYSWHPLSDTEHYLEFAMETQRELEEIFGKGSVKGFVYPHGNQKNQRVIDYLTEQGYTNIRRTSPRAKDNFSLPESRYPWTYNAEHTDFLDLMEQFDQLPDDGELKMFSFGVHPIDYDKNAKWEDLITFAATYGNRPSDFFYGTVDDIFGYEDAIRTVTVEGGRIINNSEAYSVYFKHGNERLILAPHSAYDIDRRKS